MVALLATGVLVGLIVAYIYKLNQVLRTTPPAAKKHAIPTLTDEEARSTYERIQREKIPWEKNLSVKQNRRYIVVGGSGEPPESHGTPVYEAYAFWVR